MAKKKAAERELFSHIRPKSVFAEASLFLHYTA
jgi:hypothetical protein